MRVVVGRADDETPAVVRHDQLFEPTEPGGERRRVTGHVHHDPAVPLRDAHRNQPERFRIEAGRRGEARCRAERSVECVRPSVIRAVDRRTRRRRAARQQLAAAVAAHVEEPAERSVVAADEHDRVVTDRECAPRAGNREAVGATDADPARGEEVFALPREHGVRCVSLAREHAAGAVLDRARVPARPRAREPGSKFGRASWARRFHHDLAMSRSSSASDPREELSAVRRVG